MKINPHCPVFRVLSRAAGIKPEALEVEENEDDDEKLPTKYKTLDASDTFISPRESSAQQWIAQGLVGGYYSE